MKYSKRFIEILELFDNSFFSFYFIFLGLDGEN
jgi:hypothetical protein